MVKYVRNNYLLPGLHVLNLDELNKTLWEKAEKDRERKHYEKESFISQLFEEDRKAFWFYQVRNTNASDTKQ